MPKIHELTGQRFGRLTAIRATHSTNNHRMWLCECECGAKKLVPASRLAAGRVRSCGCLIADAVRAKNTRHGHAQKGGKSIAYTSWMNMKGRCLNPNNPKYPRYGGRGIRVCERWMDFANFLADMGDRPSGSSIERIDNNGHYEKGNCAWATPADQANNRHSNRVIELNGRRMTLAMWGRETGIGWSTIWYRIFVAKWPVERAVSTPPDPTAGQFKPKAA